MSQFVNCGAAINGGENYIRTKKRLKELLATEPETVWFEATSLFESTRGWKAPEIPANAIMSVVGPDPYRDRKWYASVTRRVDGTFQVK